MALTGPRAGISVFLSYPKPCRQDQQAFVTRVSAHLEDRGFAPRTLGVTDYDMDAPLKAIRRLMLESHGLITIAFGRTFVESGVTNYRSDLGLVERPVRDSWLTTPWAHIEPAMAYQIGLPVLIFREVGVVADGVLEKGVIGTYMPEVDLSASPDAYFASEAWRHVIAKWEGYVRAVVEAKGNPPETVLITVPETKQYRNAVTALAGGNCCFRRTDFTELIAHQSLFGRGPRMGTPHQLGERHGAS